MTNPEIQKRVLVLPRWSIHYEGRVYRGGEEVTLPLSVAIQWAQWGSVAFDSGFSWKEYPA